MNADKRRSDKTEARRINGRKKAQKAQKGAEDEELF
jgi:hypothetical protein